MISAYKTLQPLSAAVLAAMFLHEAIGWAEAAGFVTIISGLLLVTRVTVAPGVLRPSN